MTDLFGGFGTKIMSTYELAKRLGSPELLLQISDLQMELANLKSAYADSKNENTELKSEITSLKEKKSGSGIIQVPVRRT